MFDRNVWHPILNKVRDFIVNNIPESKERQALLFFIGEWRYHFWHNSPPMPSWAWAMDIDFVELGNGLMPLALIETKTENTTRPNWQIEVSTKIAQKLNVPYYDVIFPITLDNFKVIPMSPANKPFNLSETEMQQWLQSLRKGGCGVGLG